MISVVINADDYGLSDGVCRAINELLEQRAVSNTTIMVTAAGARTRIPQWGGNRLKGIAGLHLTLSDDFPISPPSDIPSLVDPATGALLPRESLRSVDPSDVDREWERQIEVATELLGAPPTHLDSHKGVHRMPECIDVYLSLAKKHNIPVRGGLTPEFAERMKSAGVKGSTVMIRDWTGHSLGIADLLERLQKATVSLGESDVVEVVAHPAYCDDYLVSVSTLNRARDDDRVALHQMAAKGILARNGFTLVRYPHFTKV